MASSGITKAANAIPNGCAVWRIPIATPRCSGGNQPVTSRPLAVMVLAAAMPPSNRSTPAASMELTEAAANDAAAVSAKPTVSTIRSPIRSSRYPQANRVAAMPRLGMAVHRAPSASPIWRSAFNAGIRKTTPLMKTVAHNVAVSDTVSIDQRLVVLIS